MNQQPRKIARLSTLVAAAAIGAAGLLTFPAVAQASPMAPAAACDRYEVKSGLIQIYQDNDVLVQLNGSGVALGPSVSYAIPGRTTLTTGHAYGTIKGDTIEFTAVWDQGLGAGLSNHYTGRLGPDGYWSGTTQNNRGATNSWRTHDTLTCIAPPAKPAPPVPPVVTTPTSPTATVVSDVDLYDAPGGDGNVLRILREGEVVKVVKPCPSNDWCQLADGAGWAWGEFLRNN
jgi:hypothetical protein